MKKTVFIERLFFAVGSAVFTAGILLFLIINTAIFSNPFVIWTVFTVILLFMNIIYILTFKKLTFSKKINKFLNPMGLIACGIALILTVIFCYVIDLFQPLNLSVAASILLILGAVLLLFSGIVSVLFKSKNFTPLIVSVSLSAMLFSGAVWSNTANYQTFTNIISDPSFIFENKEGGYATFRIPSLVVLNKDSLNSNHGFSFSEDLLLATAEARKNSSKDTGQIDIVGKISTDSGKSWSKLKVLFSLKDEIGKCGNPTPVFDEINGVLNFVYLCATKASGYDYRTYNVQGILNSEYDFDFSEPILLNTEINENAERGGADGINENTLMAGPGKSLQLASGRLIIPCSNKGNSFVLYSDDFGLNWKRGQDAGEGNECEAVELCNGEVLMVIRDNINCSGIHNKQFQRFSYSKDGGETWYIKTENSTLKTPVCMSSLSRLKNGKVLITYPNDFLTRANLTLGISTDCGKNFTKKLIYAGPAGYSCITVNGKDRVFVLAEVGKINYNEALIFLELDFSTIL